MAALKASLETEVVILSYSNQLLHAIDLVSLTGCSSSSEWMCREQYGLCVKSPLPPHSTSLPPSAVASNPSFEVTSFPPSPSKQVTRPAVAMVTSHIQSQDGGREERGGGWVPITRTTQSHPASARLHTGNLFLCATFLQHRI